MKKIVFAILLLLGAISCSEDDLIPEAQLQEIITESLISEAMINRISVRQTSHTERMRMDSLDIYAPILRKYGYDLGDFRHTISVLAMRKSNPLDNIFTQVSEQIKIYDDIATYRYKQMLKFDTLALNHYVDTVWMRDTTINGSFNKFKINILPGRAGKYKIIFDYKTLTDPRVSSKSFRYEATSRVHQRATSSFWLNRKEGVQTNLSEFELLHTYDSLKIFFSEFKLPKDVKIKDTSQITNFKVIHYPPLEKVRQDYYYYRTGFAKSIKEHHEKLFPHLVTSVAIPFERPRRDRATRGGGVRPAGASGKREDSSAKPRRTAPDSLP